MCPRGWGNGFFHPRRARRDAKKTVHGGTGHRLVPPIVCRSSPSKKPAPRRVRHAAYQKLWNHPWSCRPGPLTGHSLAGCQGNADLTRTPKWEPRMRTDRGAHASRVLCSASRRKPRHPSPPGKATDSVTKVWARRPNRHAGRVRSPFPFRSPGQIGVSLTGVVRQSAGTMVREAVAPPLPTRSLRADATIRSGSETRNSRRDACATRNSRLATK